jgi:hypothetical protein
MIHVLIQSPIDPHCYFVVGFAPGWPTDASRSPSLYQPWPASLYFCLGEAFPLTQVPFTQERVAKDDTVEYLTKHCCGLNCTVEIRSNYCHGRGAGRGDADSTDCEIGQYGEPTASQLSSLPQCRYQTAWRWITKAPLSGQPRGSTPRGSVCPASRPNDPDNACCYSS